MKFAGVVGFAVQKEIRQGVYQPQIIERMYKGDVLQRSSRWQPRDNSANDDLDISNRISIVANQFAFENFHAIKYIVWMGTCWSVKSISVEPPRLVMEIGGVYNGKRPEQ